jgi:uncharacterized protein with NAD-binding domain and iron-sulfur cluster
MGFYENAFQLLRECYAELAAQPDAPSFGDWRDAFITEHSVGLSARAMGEDWHNWSTVFPPRPGLPGDRTSAKDLLSVQRYMAGALHMLGALVESVDSRQGSGGVGGLERLTSPPLISDPQAMAAAIRAFLSGAVAINAAVLAEGLALLQAGLDMLPAGLANPLTDLAGWLAGGFRRWLEKLVQDEPYYQHVWEMMDIVVAVVVGLLRFRVLTDPRGFDAIDDYDIREWLRLNGASERSLASAFVSGSYDLGMAYEDGDPDRPRLSAAVGLRTMFRMYFTYRGALYWRMRAGMGDIVFAPYYELLRRRGVKFQFFHRLRNVRLSEPDPGGTDDPYVATLEFDIQAQVNEAAEYQPLVTVKGRPCWPAQPDFTQLVDGEAFAAEGRDFESHWENRRVDARTLEVGRDFDFVVLGVSVGEAPNVCGEILARDARWRQMVQAVRTVETQAFQIWLTEDLEQLGWKAPNYIGSAFIKPFESWCDMAHTVPEEDWADPPRTVIYFCGALPPRGGPSGAADPADPTYPARRTADAMHHALTHLRVNARPLWPAAYDAHGEFRWSVLKASEPTDPARPEDAGSERFAAQYWRANVNPTDRYVLSVPGSAAHRISPLDRTYDNMTVTGDWTSCGMNEGCVEAAVISGRLAAHAIAASPRLEEIIGYDHP